MPRRIHVALTGPAVHRGSPLIRSRSAPYLGLSTGWAGPMRIRRINHATIFSSYIRRVPPADRNLKIPPVGGPSVALSASDHGEDLRRRSVPPVGRRGCLRREALEGRGQPHLPPQAPRHADLWGFVCLRFVTAALTLSSISPFRALKLLFALSCLGVDRVFDQSCKNVTVYNVLTKSIIDAAVNGFNGIVVSFVRFYFIERSTFF